MSRRSRSRKAKKSQEEDNESDTEKSISNTEESLDGRLSKKRKFGFRQFLQTFVDREKTYGLVVETGEDNVEYNKRKKRKGYPNRSPAKTVDDIHMPNPTLPSVLSSTKTATPTSEVNDAPSTISEHTTQE
ncbi:cytochrome c oxidase subunit 1 [Acrasis kona]|uniref:Cytochrome c oxidase subunit 1 n=1 Tax=Acrasis kona TaxID=1008807 RepID=A0AAW2Z2L4_9EUKA